MYEAGRGTVDEGDDVSRLVEVTKAVPEDDEVWADLFAFGNGGFAGCVIAHTLTGFLQAMLVGAWISMTGSKKMGIFKWSPNRGRFSIS